MMLTETPRTAKPEVLYWMAYLTPRTSPMVLLGRPGGGMRGREGRRRKERRTVAVLRLGGRAERDAEDGGGAAVVEDDVVEALGGVGVGREEKVRRGLRVEADDGGVVEAVLGLDLKGGVRREWRRRGGKKGSVRG